MEKQWIRDNMETEQIVAAKPVQITVETEAALPGGLREEAKVYYADAVAVMNGGEAAQTGCVESSHALVGIDAVVQFAVYAEDGRVPLVYEAMG